jgi:TM2 domain-containing membrane protein YozV
MPSFKTLNFITTGISTILSIILLFFPKVIFLLFGIDGNASAYFISRRASMFCIGYAVICYFSRNSKPSESRQSISLGIALSMLGFAILGIFEFLRGFAGAGIFLAVSAELIISVCYFSVWRFDGKVKA